VPGFVNYKKGCTRLAATSDKVYKLLAHGRWFSPGILASSTTKTGCHDIAESGVIHQKSINPRGDHHIIKLKISLYHFDIYVFLFRLYEISLFSFNVCIEVFMTCLIWKLLMHREKFGGSKGGLSMRYK
jgi:hypothetical protein